VRGHVAIAASVVILVAGSCPAGLAQMTRSWFCPGEAARQTGLVRLMAEVGVLQDKQQFNQAEDKVQAALANDPNNPLLKALVAEILIVRGDNPAALLLLREVIRKHPDSAIAHELLAVALDPSNRSEADEIAYQQKIAMELKPCMPIGHANLGFTLLGKHEFPAAAAEFRHAISLSPEYAIAYQGLGEALLSIGETDNALRLLRRAVALLPRTWNTHASLAEALILTQRMGEGLAEYRVAVQLNPGNAQLGFQYCKALVAAGQSALAVRELVSMALGRPPIATRCLSKRMSPPEENKVGSPPRNLFQVLVCLLAIALARYSVAA
jgi:tetratricopeptide (TPR) repeat protein